MIGAGAIWGLGVALSWGITDFCIKQVSEKLGAGRSNFYVDAVSLGPLLLYLWWRGEPFVLWPAFGLALLIGCINLFANLVLYRAYALGDVGVVSPIVATYSIFTVILALLILRERPSALALTGIALAIAGVGLVALPRLGGDLLTHFRWQEVRLPLLAAVSFGLTFFLLDYVVDDLGEVLPVIAFRCATITALTAAAVAGRISLRLPEAAAWPVLGLLILTDTLGYVLYNRGIELGFVSITVTLSSLYTLVAVLLAFIFLRERLLSHQYGGVGLVVIGLVLVVGG